MATKPVKYFSSTHTGAPALSGQAGKMVDVLNACLVDGFNPKTLTALSVTGGVLTGTCTAHGYVTDQTLLISGANESALNGEWTVTSYTADNFTADATGVSNTTGTGTISCKVAPLGWTRYTGTNKAAFSSSAVESNKFWYRIDDSGTLSARIVGYEQMWDVDSGVNAFPTSAQFSGGLYLGKSTTADATARSWVLVGDSRTFYVHRNTNSAGIQWVDMFGEFSSTYSHDVYNTVITGENIATPNNINHVLTAGVNPSNSSIYFARSFSSLGGSASGSHFRNLLADQSGMTAGFGQPTLFTNTIVLASPVIYEASGYQPRAYSVPGLYNIAGNNYPTHNTVYSPATGLPGRRFVALDCQVSTNGGKLFLDITGPWW